MGEAEEAAGVRTTLALEIAAPEGSVTIPRSVPAPDCDAEEPAGDCDSANVAHTSKQTTPKEQLRTRVRKK
jgi:hypothetical protein